MSLQQTRTLVAAVTVAMLSLGVTPNIALANFVTVAPTGDGAAEEAKCQRFQNAINSWADAAAEAGEKGDKKGNDKAIRNVNGLMNSATDEGCFIIHH